MNAVELDNALEARSPLIVKWYWEAMADEYYAAVWRDGSIEFNHPWNPGSPIPDDVSFLKFEFMGALRRGLVHPLSTDRGVIR